MIIGAHSITYSTNPELDRALLRDVFKLPHVDVGHGWLIFGLPPAEVAVHPSEKNDVHEFYLMCDDVDAFVTEMRKRGLVCGPVHNEGWGLLRVTLPGGGNLGVYQPRHARPKTVGARTGPRKAGGRARKRQARSSPSRSGAANGERPAA